MAPSTGAGTPKSPGDGGGGMVVGTVGALALLRKPIDLPEVGRLVREGLAQAGKLG